MMKGRKEQSRKRQTEQQGTGRKGKIKARQMNEGRRKAAMEKHQLTGVARPGM